MVATLPVLWSDTISRLYHVAFNSAFEQRLHFTRLAVFPASLANWPSCLGTPGGIQLAVIVAALLTCYFQLRHSDLDTKNRLGIWIICYVLSTLLTNFALVAWLSRIPTA